MNPITKKRLVLTGIIIFSCFVYSFGQTSQKATYQLRTSGITISLSADGEIKSLAVNGKRFEKPVFAYTTIAGCRQEGTTTVKKTGDKMISFERRLVNDSLRKSCVLIDHFISTATGVRWELTVKGNGEPWGSVIQTRIQYPAGKNTLFWTTWNEPQYNSSAVDERMAERLKVYPSGSNRRFTKINWVDPLIPVPFSDSKYDYGAPHFTYQNNQIGAIAINGDIICIPMASVIEPDHGVGLTFALSPDDEIIDMTLKTSARGDIVFNRLFNRISPDRECLFSMDIAAHADDWRPALAWMTRRYPEYFHPVNPQAHILGGTGAYSNHYADFDAEKMQKMCFTVNWQASFDFPYMGMFLPPVNANEKWNSFKGEEISVKAMNDYAADMKKQGFFAFNYFNVAEFGNYVIYPYEPRAIEDDKNLWKHNNDYLNVRLSKAILPRPDACVTKPEYVGAARPEPWYSSWHKCIYMDCAEETYRKFLLDQAQRHVNEIPDAFGITIDRMDLIRLFNERADDGITWFEGKPVRSLVNSWKWLMEDLGPIFHTRGKYILVNNLVSRIDVLKHVDGVFNEVTFAGGALNSSALLCIHKPALGWTDGVATVKKEGGDAFFQKYLYMGVFPMCPFPGNDHSIRPDPEVDQIYLDYGPLMRLMQSRQWVLEPHAVSVENNLAKVNIFKIPDGYSIPVVYGEGGKVRVKIANIEGLSNQTACGVYHPGKETPSVLKISKSGNFWYVDVPLERGCAMLKLSNQR